MEASRPPRTAVYTVRGGLISRAQSAGAQHMRESSNANRMDRTPHARGFGRHASVVRGW